MVQKIDELKADVLAIANHGDNYYATGVDSRVIHCKVTDGHQVQLTSKFRGQSHDIKAMLMLNDDKLVSAGETTDMCIYALE